MATNQKKGKNVKDGERKTGKRTEENSTGEDAKTERPEDTSAENQTEQEPPRSPTPPPKPPTPEIVYEEPVLQQLIVQQYDGEKAFGLYDGEGEASFSGGHTYKGQFAEGLMHGSGVYTWADGITYTGNFTQNKVTGKGSYKWPDGSTYDGDVFNGLRHGMGTFRCPGNKMAYSGEWHMGTRQGKGRMDYDSEGRSFYEGDWINNMRHGWGIRGYPSGNLYQGMWFNNMRHGEGTMQWLNCRQLYTGQWENGIQHGMGQHAWVVNRTAASQYPLQNMYEGEFDKGLRTGHGTFYYANGARYEGMWKDNMKHGKGKFVFKNGRIYEGTFDKDHIVEYPDFQMDGMSTPDLTQIRTRTPLPSEMSVQSNDSQNTYSPSFQLDIGLLLQQLPEADRDEEASQVMFVIMRHITTLRKVYSFYSSLGYDSSPNNTFIMNHMQFWRFMLDCQLHYGGTALADLDRLLALHMNRKEDVHSPYGKILFREFTNCLIPIAFHLYHEEYDDDNETVLSWCLSKLIADNIMKHSCKVKGYIYTEARRAVNALVHLDKTYDVYQSCHASGEPPAVAPNFTMRQLLLLLKDLNLVNNDLSAKAIVEVLAADNPNVCDEEGAVNLELEMTFLEMFEALVGCAEWYVTEAVMNNPQTPRPSTLLTQEPSMMSLSASASRGPSLLVVEDESETESPQPRSASQMTAKTPDGSQKPEIHLSNTTTVSEGGAGNSSHQIHPGSARKSGVDLLTPAEAGKSMSSYSMQSGATEGVLLQSLVSMGDPLDTEVGDKNPEMEPGITNPAERAEEEEPVDEATQQFNFWAQQLHIFFMQKFFPSTQNFLLVKRLVQTRNELEKPGTPVPAAAEEGSMQGNGDGTEHDAHDSPALVTAEA